MSCHVVLDATGELAERNVGIYRAVVINRGAAQQNDSTFEFEAASDTDAVARLPALDDQALIELWSGDRLTAIVSACSSTFSSGDFQSEVARRLREQK